MTTQVIPTSVDASALRRPREITLATRLLWGTLLLGALNSMLQWSYSRQIGSVGSILTVQGATLVVMAWLVYQVGRGRNWARILLLLLFVAGIALEPSLRAARVARVAQGSTIGGAIVIVQLLIQLVSYYLLFVSPGRAWYARATRGV